MYTELTLVEKINIADTKSEIKQVQMQILFSM